jgi:hypothetical protein
MAPSRRTVIAGIPALAFAAAADRAAAADAPLSLPRASDIVISLRNAERSLPEAYLRKAETALSTYRPDRVEWHYASPSNLIQTLKDQWGVKFVGATINANAPLPSENGLARDFDGNVIIAPWMRAPGWNARWTTVASRRTRDVLLAWIDRGFAAGADGLQVDDGWFQWVTEAWGAGDFSEASIKGFGPWLEAHIPPAKLNQLKITAGPDFNFRDWLKQKHGVHDAATYRRRRGSLPGVDLWRRYLASDVLEFWAAMRTHVRALAPTAPISANVGFVRPDETFIGLSGYIDYTVSELPVDQEPSVYALSGATAEAVGLPFVGCFSGKASDERYRRLICAAFGSGINPAAPWDVFVPSINEVIQPRHSPAPSAFADLYDFVRDHRQLIDGWRGAGDVAVVVPVAAYSNKAVTTLTARLTAAQVPFLILPTDSAYRQLHPRFTGIRTLVLAQPRAAYSSETLRAISQSRIPVLTAEQLDPAWLTSRSVGLLTGTTGWRLATRCMADNPRKWIVHVTPSLADASTFKGTVTFHRSGRFGLSPETRLRLFQPKSGPVILRPTNADDRSIVYSMPGIEDWAVLEPLD